MIRIRTGSRLHFGLFSLPSTDASAWLDQEGAPTLPRRHFGGVGLMIDRPGIELTVEPATNWFAEGPLAQRALQFAQSYCHTANIAGAFQLRILSAQPEHAGLGAGTQLGLAVARALAEMTGQEEPKLDAASLAQSVGRGRRSAIGVHGFQHGGFLVEAGKTTEDSLSPLLLQIPFPDEWSVLLIVPRDLQGTHGRGEIETFAALANRSPDDRATETLCRIVLLGMLPGLAERDLAAFSTALYDFNRRVGTLFQPAQKGIYAHSRVEQIIKSLRDLGIKGVGQSSWGPAVFAVTLAEQMGAWRDLLVRKQIAAPDELFIANPWNRGAVVSKEN